MPNLVDNQGALIELGEMLGRGGEGSVFALTSPTFFEHVAKVYHAPVSAKKGEKLAAMAARNTLRLSQIAAWPTATLHAERQGPAVGFLMPRASGEPLHTLYSPKDRVRAFPEAGWAFLLRAAANAARAVAALHESGHVIGDVNPHTFFVSERATIRLIDCDSFQIAAPTPLPARTFSCDVGVDAYTPPELQGKGFRGLLRTPNHDAFGLAVLIFQLLFMGRHPFNGRYLGPEPKSLEACIAENRFAYSKNAADYQMSPPRGAILLGFLPSTLSSLFERAFASSGSAPDGRPRPQEWIACLARMEKELRVCAVNPVHQLPRRAVACPWCGLELKLQISLFGSKAANLKRDVFDLPTAWASICAVPAPHVAEFPVIEPATIVPDSAFVEAAKQLRRAFGLGAAFGNARERKNAALAAMGSAKNAHESLRKRWEEEASEARFRKVLSDLQLKKQRYEELECEKAHRLEILADQVRERHLSEYLRQFTLADVKIPYVDAEKMAQLAAAGVLTAADIVETDQAMVLHGNAHTNLVSWRRLMATSFVHEPDKFTSPADASVIENDVQRRQIPLQEGLQTGAETLQRTGAEIRQRQEDLLPAARQTARDLAQAEANYHCFGKPS